MKTPAISIVVPIYNAERTINKCVDSILAQTYEDYELILVNDGSSDSSLNICKQYSEEYKKIVVINNENGGVSSARNSGIRLAKGEWITFIDSDDWIAPNFLATFAEMQKINAESNLLIQSCQTVCLKTSQKVWFRFYPSEVNLCNVTDYKELNSVLEFGTPWAKLFKLTIIKEKNLTFDESFRFHEDHLFYLKYMMHTSSILLSDNIGYFYDVTPRTSSLSRGQSIKYLNEVVAKDYLVEYLNSLKAKYNWKENQLKSINTLVYGLPFRAFIKASRNGENQELLKNLCKKISLKEIITRYRPTSVIGFLVKYAYLCRILIYRV